MTTVLYAQPYDITAKGFFFETAEDYAREISGKVNRHGLPVEEFEIQFVDGARIDAVLAEAFGLHQGVVTAFFRCIEAWDDQTKRLAIIAVKECGVACSLDDFDPENADIDLYEDCTMRDLAEQFVDDGLFGDVPDRIVGYLDMEAIARDLAMDYSETAVAGRRIVYRCG